jgi:hypothetical protein
MKILYTIILVLTVFGLLMMSHTSDKGITPAFASLQAMAREAMENGQPVGEVVVGNDIVFRIRTVAGGQTSVQRAQTAADRLNQQFADNLTPEQITTGQVNGQEVVMANGQVIVTADESHARMNGTTPVMLADQWSNRLSNVVAGRPVDERRVAEKHTANVNITEKIVPIISIGDGTRLGGALVTGESKKVDQVVAVGQLDGTFSNAVRARVLIPVSSTNFINNIRRVPGTSVAGLVDIRL